MPEIEISNIDPGERVRVDYSEIKSIAESLQEEGQMQNIEVTPKDSLEDFESFDEPEDGFDPEKNYLLVLGGRRFFAAQLLQWETIEASITEGLNEIDYRTRELTENLERRELSWDEEVKAKRQLHRLKVKKHGAALHGPGDEGWAAADTAKELEESEASTSLDLKLADALDEFPEVEEEADSKSQARNMVKKKRDQEKRSQKAQEMKDKKKAGKTEKMKEALCDRYIRGDFFKVAEILAREIEQNPDTEPFNLVELDPPYGINFDAMVDGSFGRTPSNTVYTDLDESEIDRFMTEAARRAYDLLAEDGWLLFWMSGQYSERSRSWLEEAGFTLPNLPAIWNTRSGRCRNSKYNLAHDSEYFWYARKGSPTINPNARGRSNVFTFRRVEHSARYHDNQAPIKLYESLFRTFSRPDDKLISGFTGSGSALLAAHNLGLDAIGVDIDRDGQYKDSFEAKVWDGEIGNYNDETKE